MPNFVNICTSGINLRLTKAKFLAIAAQQVDGLDTWMKDSISIWPNRFYEICCRLYGFQKHLFNLRHKLLPLTAWARGQVVSAMVTALVHYMLTGGSKELLRQFVKVRYTNILDPSLGLIRLRPAYKRVISFKAYRPTSSLSTNKVVEVGAKVLTEVELKPEDWFRLLKVSTRLSEYERVLSASLTDERESILAKLLTVSPLKISSTLKLAYYVGLLRLWPDERVKAIFREADVASMF